MAAADEAEDGKADMREAEEVLARDAPPAAAVVANVRRYEDGDSSGAGADVRARGVRVRLGDVDGARWLAAAGVWRVRGGDEDETTYESGRLLVVAVMPLAGLAVPAAAALLPVLLPDAPEEEKLPIARSELVAREIGRAMRFLTRVGDERLGAVGSGGGTFSSRAAVLVWRDRVGEEPALASRSQLVLLLRN